MLPAVGESQLDPEGIAAFPAAVIEVLGAANQKGAEEVRQIANVGSGQTGGCVQRLRLCSERRLRQGGPAGIREGREHDSGLRRDRGQGGSFGNQSFGNQSFGNQRSSGRFEGYRCRNRRQGGSGVREHGKSDFVDPDASAAGQDNSDGDILHVVVDFSDDLGGSPVAGANFPVIEVVFQGDRVDVFAWPSGAEKEARVDSGTRALQAQ